MNPRRLALLLLVCFAVLGLSACDPNRQGHDMKTNATTLPLPPMRTHCIGRLLIDLPDDFEVAPLSEVELIYGLDENWRKVKVMAPRISQAQPGLETLVAQHVTELTSLFDADTPSKNKLDLQRRVDADTVLVRAHDEVAMQGYFKSIVFARKEQAVGSFAAGVYKRDKAQDIEAKLLSIAQSTRYLAEPSKAGRGTCLGPLLIDAGQDGEWFMLSFHSPKDPVLHIGVYMHSLRAKAEDGGLLDRTDRRTAEFLRPMGIKLNFFRRGKVSMAGGPGEEQAFRYEENGVEYLSFAAEVLQSSPATFAVPVINVEMKLGGQLLSGEYRGASMSEKDALALWDAIIKSIRPRPGAV